MKQDLAQRVRRRAAMTIEPTRTMPWIEFAPDISGVWSVAGTFEITANPHRIARMKTVRS